MRPPRRILVPVDFTPCCAAALEYAALLGDRLGAEVHVLHVLPAPVLTLTAQGRMARWILSALPVCAGIGLWLLQPNAVWPLLHTPTGQLMLVVAAALVVTGSFVIQKIVDIKV